MTPTTVLEVVGYVARCVVVIGVVLWVILRLVEMLPTATDYDDDGFSGN